MAKGFPMTGPLRLAANAVHLVEFFFRRADRSGDIYPTDAPYGQVPGVDPDRIMVIGERGEISLGVVTHELSIAGYIAREHHQRTGRGCAWSVATLPGDSIDDGRALVTAHAAEIARTDVVIVLVGIIDCLTLTSAARWHRGLDEMLTALFDELPLDAHVAVAEIPPLGNAGSLSRAARLAAGYRSTLLNHRTRKLVRAHPRATAVPFPPELTDRLWVPQSQQERYTRTYALWSRSLMAACLEARHLGAPTSRHSAARQPRNRAPLPEVGP